MKFTYAFVALLTVASAAFAAPIAGTAESHDVDVQDHGHHLHHYGRIGIRLPRALPDEDAHAKTLKAYAEAAARRKAQKARAKARKAKVALAKADLEAALEKFDEAADDIRVLLGKPREHKKKSKSKKTKSRVYKKKMF